MPTEKLFGGYHFLLETAGEAKPTGVFVFEPDDAPLWVSLEEDDGAAGYFTMFTADGSPIRAAKGPSQVAAGGTDVAMEELALSHEGFETAQQFFTNGGQKVFVQRVATEEDGFAFKTEAPAPEMVEYLVPGVYVEEISAPQARQASDEDDGTIWLPDVGDEVL